MTLTLTITVLTYDRSRTVIGVNIFHNVARAQRFIERVTRAGNVAVIDEATTTR